MLINNCVWEGTGVQVFSNLVPVYLQTEDMGTLPSCAGCYLKLLSFCRPSGSCSSLWRPRTYGCLCPGEARPLQVRPAETGACLLLAV